MTQTTLPDHLFEGYLFDLDGTIYLGNNLLPTVAETISVLRNENCRLLFLSNNPTRSVDQVVSRLAAMGVSVAHQEVLTSTQVLIEFLNQVLPGGRLFVIGELPLQSALQTAGFKLVDRAKDTQAVIASFDRTFNYKKLQTGFDALRAGARFFATNADRYCPVPGGGEPDAAALIAALEACSERKVEAVLGKPSPWMAQAALTRLGLPAGSCIITGDRLETDVALGAEVGMATCLVLTGATSSNTIALASVQPDYILVHLNQVLPWNISYIHPG